MVPVGVSKDATCGRGEENKKGQTFIRQTGPDHPRRHRPPEILHAGPCPRDSFIFQVS